MKQTQTKPLTNSGAGVPVKVTLSFQPGRLRAHCHSRLPAPSGPRRRCLTAPRILAALRAAELSAWVATGGDFLSSIPEPIN